MKYFWTELQRRQKHTSCCFEFRKGAYREEDPHWQEDSICLYADIFDELELYPLFRKAVPQFDYCGPTEVTKKQWQALLGIAKEHGGEALQVVMELSQWAEACLREEEVFTILGI